MSRRRAWVVAIAAVAIAGVFAVLTWRGDPRSVAHSGLLTAVLPDGLLRFPAAQTPVASSDKSLAAKRATAGAADPVGRASDLKRIFDQYIVSRDPRERRMAVRAFEACVPAFLPAAGQSPSPEPLIAALPAGQRAEREVAYRSLYARCHRFLTEDRAALDANSKVLQHDTQNEALGMRARNALLAGDLERVEPLVAEALNSADPAAVESLSGLVVRLAQARHTEDLDATLLQSARAVDAALPLVGCDLGLDCSAQSLWALQLCTVEGLCDGDLAARLAARMGPGTIDPVAVQQQRVRLLDLIRSGRTLGSADLLP